MVQTHHLEPTATATATGTGTDTGGMPSSDSDTKDTFTLSLSAIRSSSEDSFRSAVPIGLAIKTLPNGLAHMQGSPTPSEISIDDDEKHEPGLPDSPKRGGFGVRTDRVLPRSRSKSDSEGTSTTPTTSTSTSTSKKLHIHTRRATRNSLIDHPLPPTTSEWGANFWCIITDPKTQNSFFANPQTGECRWQVPAGTIVLPPNPDGEWWELFDEHRALPYYYHTTTANTVWVRPKGFVIPLTAIQESTLGRRFSRLEFGQENLSALARASVPSAADLDLILTPPRPHKNGQRRQQQQQQQQQQPPPPLHSPSPSLAADKAPRRIIGSDRELVAQALATRPLQRPLNGKLSRKESLTRALASNVTPSRPKATVSFDTLPPRTAMSSEQGTRSRGRALVTFRSARDMGATLDSPSNARSMRQSSSEPSQLYSRFPTLDPPSPSEPRGPIRRERDPAKRLSPLYAARQWQWQQQQQTQTQTQTQTQMQTQTQTQTHREQDALPARFKRMSTGDHRCMPPDLQSDIARFAFEGFAQRNFTTHRVGPFRRKMPMEKLMQWQKTPINAPLLNLPFRNLQKDAIKIFKIIQRVMGDRDAPVHSRPPGSLQALYGTKIVEDSRYSAMPVSPRAPSKTTNGLPLLSPTLPPHHARDGGAPGASFASFASFAWVGVDEAHARAPSVLEEEHWMLERGLASRPLRDEIYVQTIKQLRGNPSGASVFRGWQLLCVAVVTFAPSADLRDYLFSFIDSAASTSTDEAVTMMAKHCSSRLRVICRRVEGLGATSIARQKAPTIAEIQSASDAAFNPGVFGHTLERIMATQQQAYPDIKVPVVLVFLCNALMVMDALKTEGIFRVAGDGDLVTELKVRIERGHYQLDGIVGMAGPDGDVAVLASVLKLWLRELETPLIPAEVYDRCIAGAEQPTRCVEIVRRLPTLHRRTLLYLISFLQLFTSPAAQKATRMPVESLALVFAPNLFRCESDRLSVVFNNTKYEQHFVASLLHHLPASTLDEDFKPTHGGANPVHIFHRPGGTLETVTDVSYTSASSEDGAGLLP